MTQFDAPGYRLIYLGILGQYTHAVYHQSPLWIKSVILSKLPILAFSERAHHMHTTRTLICIAVLSLATQVYPATPFLTEDAEPVEFNHGEFNLFSTLDKSSQPENEPDLNAPAVELNFGPAPNVELHLIIPYAWSLPRAALSAHGIGDTEIGIKYRFLQETKNIPQITVSPLMEIPSGNAHKNLGNGKLWFKLPISIQKSWGNWTTYGGGGYAINSSKNMRDYPFAGWLLQKNLNENLTLGLEIYTQGANSINTHSRTLLNTGGSYNFTQHLSLLFSAGGSIIGEKHTVAYIGLLCSGP